MVTVTTTSTVTLRSSAPARQRQVLAGSQLDGTVLARFASALYVQVPAGFGVIALVTRDAVRLPCALQLPTACSEFPLDRLRGRVRVGGGVLRIGDVAVTADRTVSATVPKLAPPPAEQVRAAEEMLDVSAFAPPGLGDPRLASGAGRRLLGRGEGLTPQGDDVLAGYLAAAAAYRLPADSLRSLVRAEAQRRTTTLSAALLRHAAEGEAIPQISALLESLRDGRSLRTAIADLVGVGHTSGSALAAGVLVAARSASTAAGAARCR